MNASFFLLMQAFFRAAGKIFFVAVKRENIGKTGLPKFFLKKTVSSRPYFPQSFYTNSPLI